MNKIKILVCGSAGKMGSSIIRLAKGDEQVQITGAVDIGDDFDSPASKADVIVDFTTPASTIEHLSGAKKSKKAIVIGTTGFDAAQLEKIKEASAIIPVVLSPNMSMGVNVLFKLAAEAAKAMPGYDVEIVELHHNQKKDAPSGTALKLAQIIALALKRALDKVCVYGRKGDVGARKSEEIAVLSVRGGDIVGEHTVYFVGKGERLELTHRAQSRDTLAAGALSAAKWLSKQKPGLYDMSDVLNLK